MNWEFGLSIISHDWPSLHPNISYLDLLRWDESTSTSPWYVPHHVRTERRRVHPQACWLHSIVLVWEWDRRRTQHTFNVQSPTQVRRHHNFICWGQDTSNNGHNHKLGKIRRHPMTCNQDNFTWTTTWGVSSCTLPSPCHKLK